MFYEAVGAQDCRSIGLAVSEDGKTGWQRLSRCSPLAALPVASACSGETLLQPRCVFSSPDLISNASQLTSLNKVAAEVALPAWLYYHGCFARRPLLEPSADASAWDSGGVGAPCAVPMAAGAYRLYYAGRGRGDAAPWQGIGLALTRKGSGTDADADMFYGARTDFVRRKARI
jgi:hypothetical protein